MRVFKAALLLLFANPVYADPESCLKGLYKYHGDHALVALYWLPETQESMLTATNDENRELTYPSEWERRSDEYKRSVLKALAAELKDLEDDELQLVERRIRTRMTIDTQLKMIAAFYDMDHSHPIGCRNGKR